MARVDARSCPELRTLSRLVLFDRGRPRRRLCRVGASRGSVTGVRDGGATTERHGNIFRCASFGAFRAADGDEEQGRCPGAIPSCCEGTLGGHQPTRIAMIVAIEATAIVVVVPRRVRLGAFASTRLMAVASVTTHRL